MQATQKAGHRIWVGGTERATYPLKSDQGGSVNHREVSSLDPEDVADIVVMLPYWLGKPLTALTLGLHL